MINRVILCGRLTKDVEMQKEEKALREYESHKSEGEISD